MAFCRVSTPKPGMAASPEPAAGLAGPRVPLNPVSRRQIEVVIARSAAILGLVFGAQTIPALLDQSSQLNSLAVVAIVLVFLGPLVAVVAFITRRFVRAVSTYMTLSWVVAMALWPLFVVDGELAGPDRPWPWYLLTVATAAAAVAWPAWAATVALVVLPLIYGAVRIFPAGGSAPITLVLLDILYSLILGGTVLVIISLLRQAAASVDLAQSTALERYAHAVRQHATEVERVQVDAIVHDSVLTTLLSAARSRTPEAETLAATMAQNAMGHLRDAAVTAPDDLARVPIVRLAERILATSATFEHPFALASYRTAEGDVPGGVAESIYSAAAQAMVNSAQHAGDSARRWWSFAGSAASIVVVVGDSGLGFHPASVSRARIGVRVSIIERMANAGGVVDIDSAPGSGTAITITWPDAATQQRRRFDDPGGVASVESTDSHEGPS